MEWQIMLGIRLVLVTPHGRFTISIEQERIELVALNIVLSVVTLYWLHPNSQNKWGVNFLLSDTKYMLIYHTFQEN